MISELVVELDRATLMEALVTVEITEQMCHAASATAHLYDQDCNISNEMARQIFRAMVLAGLKNP